MGTWRLVLLTLVSLTLPLAAQAARTPSKPHHFVHHVSHAAKVHKLNHRIV